MELTHDWTAARIGGWREPLETPYCEMIGDSAELAAFYTAHQADMGLDLEDQEPSFTEAMVSYDDAYFEDKALLLVFLQSGSGSNQHTVENIQIDGQTLEVDILEERPGDFGTADMAYWALFIELPAEYGGYAPQATVTTA